MTAATDRLGQGLRALFAFATPVDSRLAQAHLSQAEYAAFAAMDASEQLHSLNVLRTLLNDGEDVPRALAVAALMHDVGKSRYRLAVWQKTLYVIVSRWRPGLARRLADQKRLTWWNAAFVVGARHARWSGEILRACGTDETAVWLAENHGLLSRRDSHPDGALLRRLQAADDRN